MQRHMSRMNDDETVRKRSGWILPLGIFGVTFVLSALVLLLYLAPTASNPFNEEAAPTSRSDSVALSVGGHPLRVPANYLIFDSTRTGGERKEAALFALIPDFRGWSNWAADEFASNAPDSRVAYLTLRIDQAGLKEADKLKRVYFEHVTDKTGSEGPYGLRQYAFRKDTGYRSEDLFVGTTPSGPVVLRCVQPSPEVPSPSCLRETLLAPGLSVSLRFKRAHLENWLTITAKADALADSFLVSKK